LELHPSYGWMEPGSDSSSGGRRNIFDVPAPALAGDAAGDSNGSIFATPQSSRMGYADVRLCRPTVPGHGSPRDDEPRPVALRPRRPGPR
jgi:hypothetical protein